MLPDPNSNDIIRSIRAKVAAHGHVIGAVEAAPARVSFAYTIGLSIEHGFELAMNGAGVPDMQNALNAIAGRVNTGELRPADKLLVEGVLLNGLLLRLRPALPGWVFHWIKPALALQEQPPVWQVQFPARDGRWPEEPGYDPSPYVQQDYTLPFVGGREDPEPASER